MDRSLSCRALFGAALLGLAAASAIADTNVRPQFSVASSMPLHWGVIDHGKSLGLALEVETSARWSQIAEFDMHWLDTHAREVRWATDPYVGFPLPGGPGQWSDAVLMSGRFALRFHMAKDSKVRPYLQTGIGVRVASGTDSYGVYFTGGSSAPKPGSRVDGTTAHLRFGFTTAGYRGAGLFLDGSAEALIRNPRDFALFPVRLGITLP